MDFLFIILELIVADIILGGDNAIVIALATKNLEPKLKTKASILGASLAILLRIMFVIIVMFVGQMHIIFLNIIAGLLLIYIGLNLLDQDSENHSVKAEKSLGKAIRTIVIADAITSLDNAIIIATIATSANVVFELEIFLVVIALLFSFPIILFGSSILSKLLDRFKFLIYIFSLLLIHTAVHMILKDPLLENFHAFLENGLMNYFVWIVAIAILCIKVFFMNRKDSKQ